MKLMLSNKQSFTKSSKLKKRKSTNRKVYWSDNFSSHSISIPGARLCRRICFCCDYCCPETTEEELFKLLDAGQRRLSVLDQPLVFHSERPKKFEHGVSETGYFQKPEISDIAKSLRQLRKGSAVTENLPEPEVAIANTNAKRALNKPGKKNLSADANMSEINMMLKSRLGGSLTPFSSPTDEQGEALLKCHRTGKDYTSMILSHLVNESETRRMSAQADNVKSRFSSTFSKSIVDFKLDSKFSKKKDLKPEELSDIEFINRLTEVSTMVKQELEKDWSFTSSYVKTLEKYLRNQDFDPKKAQDGSERWMVLLYTTSEDMDDLTNFRCLLARLILQHHHIAYEERDVGLVNQPYREELQKRLDSEVITVPYVFAQGLNIGNCQVIYAIHKLKLMKTIFKNFIMPADIYGEWLTNRNRERDSGLKIDVKVSLFPALNFLMGLQTEVKLSNEDNEKAKTGKEVVRKARTQWAEMSKNLFRQPSLLRYILLKRTIFLSLSIMNDLYQNYLTKKMIGQQSAKKRKFSWLK